MTDREVKRLSRIQVLTLLRQQEEEIENQKQTITKLREEIVMQKEALTKQDEAFSIQKDVLKKQDEAFKVQKEELENQKQANTNLKDTMAKQAEEIAKLNAENQKIKSNQVKIDFKPASPAESSLTVSGIVKAAQEAANQHLENAKKIEANARQYAQTIRDNADRYCTETYTKAHAAIKELTELFELQKKRGETNLDEFRTIVTELEEKYPVISFRE